MTKDSDRVTIVLPEPYRTWADRLAEDVFPGKSRQRSLIICLAIKRWADERGLIEPYPGTESAAESRKEE